MKPIVSSASYVVLVATCIDPILPRGGHHTGSQRPSVRTGEPHLVGGCRLWSGLERCGNRQTTIPKTRIMRTTKSNRIPDRPSTGLTRTAPPVVHQGGRDKCTTGGPDKTLCSSNNTIIATWNVRTLSQLGKLKELTHEMENYNWHILRMCETRWKNSGEVKTDEGHKFYYSGEDDRHANGVGFLVHKSIQSAVLGCQPISSRIITIRLKAKPLNITIIQVYAPTTDYDDEQIEQFYNQIQTVIDKVNKKDTLIIQGDWNAKVGVDAVEDWADYFGPSSNDVTNNRGIRLLEFASFNGMVLANTLGEHKPSHRYTWHAPNGRTRTQIDYIMVQNSRRQSKKRQAEKELDRQHRGVDRQILR